MPVEEIARRVAASAGAEARIEIAFGDRTVDVPVTHWPAALTTARDEGCTYFDWLSAVDELDAGFAVVACVWRLGTPAQALLLRTRLGREEHLPSATGVYAGADWHEREVHEMFGIAVDGHPNLVPLLLPEGFEGHPLRKDFVLASRVAKPWPGAKEPGESNADVGGGGRATARRKNLPPGVPDPATWGPRRP